MNVLCMFLVPDDLNYVGEDSVLNSLVDLLIKLGRKGEHTSTDETLILFVYLLFRPSARLAGRLCLSFLLFFLLVLTTVLCSQTICLRVY